MLRGRTKFSDDDLDTRRRPAGRDLGHSNEHVHWRIGGSGRRAPVAIRTEMDFGPLRRPCQGAKAPRNDETGNVKEVPRGCHPATEQPSGASQLSTKGADVYNLPRRYQGKQEGWRHGGGSLRGQEDFGDSNAEEFRGNSRGQRSTSKALDSFSANSHADDNYPSRLTPTGQGAGAHPVEGAVHLRRGCHWRRRSFPLTKALVEEIRPQVGYLPPEGTCELKGIDVKNACVVLHCCCLRAVTLTGTRELLRKGADGSDLPEDVEELQAGWRRGEGRGRGSEELSGQVMEDPQWSCRRRRRNYVSLEVLVEEICPPTGTERCEEGGDTVGAAAPTREEEGELLRLTPAGQGAGTYRETDGRKSWRRPLRLTPSGQGAGMHRDALDKRRAQAMVEEVNPQMGNLCCEDGSDYVDAEAPARKKEGEILRLTPAGQGAGTYREIEGTRKLAVLPAADARWARRWDAPNHAGAELDTGDTACHGSERINSPNSDGGTS